MELIIACTYVCIQVRTKNNWFLVRKICACGRKHIKLDLTVLFFESGLMYMYQ